MQYNIAKPEKESESEDEDDEDDTFGPRRKQEPNWSEDPVGGIQDIMSCYNTMMSSDY